MHSQSTLPAYFTPRGPGLNPDDEAEAETEGEPESGFGESWTHMDTLPTIGRDARVESAPLGTTLSDGTIHLETVAQTTRLRKRRADACESRTLDGRDILDIDQDLRRKRPRRSADGDDAEPADPTPAPMPFHKAGVQMLRNILSTPITNNDKQAILEADVEAGLVWTPTLPPEMAQAQKEMGGPPGEHDTCWACKSGGPSVSRPAVEMMASMWRNERNYCKRSQLALNVEEAYETRIRDVANKIADAQNRPEDILGQWPATTIHEHFTRHDRSPETYLTETLRELEGMQHHLHNRGCYNVNSQDTSDVRLSKDRVMLYLNIVKTYATISKMKPSEMVGYAADMSSASVRGAPPINPKKNIGGVGPQQGGASRTAAGFVSSMSK